MQKATYISFGAMFGITLTLLIFVLTNRSENFVLAQTASRVDSGGGGGIIVATGGDTANINNLVWAIKKDGEKTFLACYKVVGGGMSPNIKLVATREIDDDLKVPELNNMPPSVEDMHKGVAKAQKEKEEREKKEEKEKARQKGAGVETGGGTEEKK